MQNETYNAILNQEKLRKTKSRQLVLEILKDSAPKTVDEIFKLAKDRDGKISISTIYRTCETLTQKDVLHKSNLLEDGKARYEYAGHQHKHHAVCMDCHNIISIDDCPFGEFSALMKSKYQFDVKNHSIEIYGYCHECKIKHPH